MTVLVGKCETYVDELNVALIVLCQQSGCELEKTMNRNYIVLIKGVPLNTKLHGLLKSRTRKRRFGEHDPLDRFPGHAHAIGPLLIQYFQGLRVRLLKVTQWSLKSTLNILSTLEGCKMVEEQFCGQEPVVQSGILVS